MATLGNATNYLTEAMEDIYERGLYGELRDVSTILQVAILLMILRYVIAGNALHGVKKRASILSWLIDRYNIAKDNKTHKLAESLWYLCWHIISFSFTLCVLRIEYGTPLNRNWLYYFLRDRRGIWFFSETPAHVAHNLVTWPHLTMTPMARSLIWLTMGFWISCCIYIHWETRRSDMRIMQFHHFTTVALLVLNYVYSFHRIGMIVILLHDIPDILLYTTKCLTYLRNCKQAYLNIAFCSYGMGHFVMRLVLMAVYVGYPVLCNMDCLDMHGGVMGYIWTLPCGGLCIVLLAVLTTMNIYWLKLIISMARKFAQGAEIADHREKDD